MFLILGIYHLKQSKHSMPPLKVKQRPFQQSDSPIKVEIDVCGSPLDQPLQNFVDDFNKYLDSQNKSNSRANQLSACGYFLAALTAFYFGDCRDCLASLAMT